AQSFFARAFSFKTLAALSLTVIPNFPAFAGSLSAPLLTRLTPRAQLRSQLCAHPCRFSEIAAQSRGCQLPLSLPSARRGQWRPELGPPLYFTDGARANTA